MQEIHLRVRFGETDALGHINNASYFIYTEEARVRFFETIGYSMETNGWQFIMASTKCNFIRQGYFNQELTIKTSVSRIGTKSFDLEHEIICTKTQQLIATGEATVVYFDFDNQQSEVIPPALKEKLAEHLTHASKT